MNPPVLAGAIDPEQYVLGPGDLLEVAYTGRSNPSERVRVTPSGRIHLAPTGPIEVAGLTLAAAEDHLQKKLAEFYAGTRITVDLLEVRRFRVHLLGHVIEPGMVETAATHRAADLLDDDEMLMEGASLRNLVLRRRGGDELAVDLVRYRLLGDLERNPSLQDGDVLYVPARRDSVSVFGRVPRPGFYEFRHGDSIEDLIALAGGFDSGADRELVELRRFSETDSDEVLSRILNIDAGDGREQVAAGDGVYIRVQRDWHRVDQVELKGEVHYPGTYGIERDGETLRALIRRAGGFTDEADPASVEVTRPDAFEFSKEDPEFLRLQAIPIHDMTNEEYEYLKLRSRQREGLASSVLSVSLLDETGIDLVLRGGDRIAVPARNLAVDVQGAVRYPGFVPYDSVRTAKDYIELAGGISERARTGKTRVIRKNTGERVAVGDRTRVDPGDLVWIPEKPDRDWWRIARETAVFLAQIGTLAIIVDSVTD